MNEIQNALLRSQLGRVEPGSSGAQGVSSKKDPSNSFDNVLDEVLQFSKHAVRRLESRQIELSDLDKAKLGDAVQSLEKKGAKDSLVLMGELAFVVNVPSRMVVTAMTRSHMEEQVFTNIDSTMLVNA